MEPLGHVARRAAPALALRGARGAILAGALLTALATGEAAGHPGGLFRETAPAAAAAGPDLSAVSDSITLAATLTNRVDLLAVERATDDEAHAPIVADEALDAAGGQRQRPGVEVAR